MNPPKNKLVLFDFDGTLANSQEVIFEIINELSDKYNYRKIKKTEIERLQDKSLPQLMKLFGVSYLKLPSIIKDHHRLIAKKIDQVPPFEGILETLTSLEKEDLFLGILTSNAKENVMNFLKNNKINSFGFVLSEKNFFGKDKSIKKIIKKNNFKKKNVVYIGDETRDIQAAKKVDIKSIAVCWGLNSRKILETKNPDLIVQDPKNLALAINNLFL